MALPDHWHASLQSALRCAAIRCAALRRAALRRESLPCAGAAAADGETLATAVGAILPRTRWGMAVAVRKAPGRGAARWAEAWRPACSDGRGQRRLMAEFAPPVRRGGGAPPPAPGPPAA